MEFISQAIDLSLIRAIGIVMTVVVLTQVGRMTFGISHKILTSEPNGDRQTDRAMLAIFGAALLMVGWSLAIIALITMPAWLFLWQFSAAVIWFIAMGLLFEVLRG